MRKSICLAREEIHLSCCQTREEQCWSSAEKRGPLLWAQRVQGNLETWDAKHINSDVTISYLKILLLPNQELGITQHTCLDECSTFLGTPLILRSLTAGSQAPEFHLSVTSASLRILKLVCTLELSQAEVRWIALCTPEKQYSMQATPAKCSDIE